MSEQILETEYFPNDRYGKQWIVAALLFLTLAAGIAYQQRASSLVTGSPPSVPSTGADWFFVLHLPEAPRDPAKDQKSQARLAQWLDALAREGYHPMLLSEIDRRLRRGEGLPEKTVALVYAPGLYHTYKTVAPILTRYRFPAVWIVDNTSLLRGDRHAINRTLALWMEHSRFWDIGYSGDGFWGRITPEQVGRVRIPPSLGLRWAPGTGRTALNHRNPWSSFHRLDISPTWTPDILIERLNRELPLVGAVHLGIKYVGKTPFGVVIRSSRENTPFSLRVPPSSTSQTVSWIGTQDARDLRVEWQAKAFFGEMFLWLRSNTATGEGIGLGLSKGHLFIDQRIQGQRLRLKDVPWRPEHGRVNVNATLAGDHLRITTEGAPTVDLDLAPGRGEGLVRLSIYDRIHNAAHTDDVVLQLTPLQPDASHP